MHSPRPGVVTIISRYARRASTVCGMSSFAKRLLQVGLLSSIASSPLSSATSAFAVSDKLCKFIYMILGCESVARALLLPDSGWHHRLRMAINRPAQVTGHQIDSHGRQHQNHAKPDPPVAMRPSPIWRLAVMNRAPIRISVRLVIVQQFIHNLLRLRQPLPRLSGLEVIEVSDRRFRERLAECRHALLPLLFPDHREALDIGEVRDTELEVLPRRASFPPVEAAHIEQHAQFSMLPDEPLELGHKVLVIGFGECPDEVSDEIVPAVFFIELNGHFKLLWFVLGCYVFHFYSLWSAATLAPGRGPFPPAVSHPALRSGPTSNSESPAYPGRAGQCNACAR